MIEIILIAIFAIAVIVMLPKVLKKILPKGGSLPSLSNLKLTSILSSLWGVALFLFTVAVVFSVGHLLYRDITGSSPQIVKVASTKELKGEEISIDLVPGQMNFGGHRNAIFLPETKFRKLVITSTIAVSSVDGGKVILHFGANNKGMAKLKMNPHRTLEWKGHELSQPGVRYVVLKEGTEIEFPPGEKPLIWFSLEKDRITGEMKTGELVFHKPKSGKSVIFSYKEMI